MVFDYVYNVEQISKKNAFGAEPSFLPADTELDIIKKHKEIEGMGEANMGFNNIGLISFTGSGASLKVKQTLFWPGASKPISSFDNIFKSSEYTLDFDINF